MSVVDDFGRYYATPMLLRAAAYPLQLDKVSDQDVGKWLGETRKAGLVGVYESGGESYLELLNFGQQIRAKKSKFPNPGESATQTLSSCLADAEQLLTKNENENENEVSVEPQGSPPPVPVLELPLVGGAQMPVTEVMVREWGSAFPAVDVLQQLREMRAWCLANPTKCKTARGAPGFIVRWLAKEQDRGGGKPSGGTLPSYT